MTIESEIALLTTATTALTQAVSVPKSALDATLSSIASSGVAAVQNGSIQTALVANQVDLSLASAQESQASSTEACAQEASAMSSAEAAAAVSDIATAVWSQATYQQETLEGQSANLHLGAVVASFVYDTGKDFDGGLWRDRCSDKSWENEPTCGKWLGQLPNTLTAMNCDGNLGAELNGAGFVGAGWSSAGASSSTDGTTGTGVLSGQALVIGKTYRFSGTVSGSGSVNVYLGSSASLLGVTGSFVWVGVCSGSTSCMIQNTQPGAKTVSSLSVKEVISPNRTTPAYFQSTTDGKFYSVDSGGTAAEVFRGNKRKFPKVAALVAENQRVVIYDLTTPDAPMWMVFAAGSQNLVLSGTVGHMKDICALNGKVYWCPAAVGLYEVSFITDAAKTTQNSGGAFVHKSSLSGRNSNAGYSANIGGPLLGGYLVKKIAVTALPDAPIDPLTMLPTPTIATVHEAGISVLKQDGTVGHISGQASAPQRIAFTPAGEIISTVNYGNEIGVHAIPTGHVNRSAYLRYTVGPIRPSADTTLVVQTGTTLAQINGQGFVRQLDSPLTPTGNMVACITNSYNTGWQVGESRLLALSSGTAETIDANEVVVNGDFDGIAGWSSAPAGFALAGPLVINASGGAIANTANVVVGAMYRVSFDILSWVSGSISIAVGGVTCGTDYTTGSHSVVVVPISTTGATVTVTYGGTVVSVGKISVKLMDSDRSTRLFGLDVVGSLTKAPVATGANLVAYSGFSATNYLEQPYNANLEFGTGGFDAGAWINTTTVPAALAAAIAAAGGLGPELVTNGDFSGGITGWTAFGDAASSLVSGGVLSVARVANYSGASVPLDVTSGKAYRIGHYAARTSGTAAVVLRLSQYPGTGGAVYFESAWATSSSMTYFEAIYVAAFTGTVYIHAAVSVAASTGTFDNISVKEITGILPIFERTNLRNLLIQSDNITSGAAMQNTTAAASLLVPSASNSIHRCYRLLVTTVGLLYTVAVRAAPGGYRYLYIFGGGFISVCFDLQTGTVVGGSGTIKSLGDGSYICAASGVASGTLVATYFAVNNSGVSGDTTYAGDGTSGIYLHSTGCFQGAYTASQVQALGGIPVTTTVVTPMQPSFSLGLDATGKLKGTALDGTTTRTVTSPAAVPLSAPTLASLSYRASGSLELTINDSTVATTGTPLLTLNSATGVFTVGNDVTGASPFPGSISLLSVSATVPSNDQRSKIYRDELAMFQSGAQCTYPGTSRAVTTAAYDSTTDLLHVGTATGRAAFKDLICVESEPTTSNALTAVSASAGMVVTAGQTAVKFSTPTSSIRDEAKLGMRAKGSTSFVDFDSIAAQTVFAIPAGYVITAVYSAGALKSVGATKDYTISRDGFREYVTFITAPGSGVWVSVQVTEA